jgi:hypothetical protein
MAHLDVVPARREDWSLDSWTLTERDGWLYGRGSSDNKAGAAMLITNFIRLKRDGWRPDRDVIVVLTGDEETSQNTIQWLLAEHRDLARLRSGDRTSASLRRRSAEARMRRVRAKADGAPGKARTCDPRFRKPVLYPAELRAPRGVRF